jgi:O-antigen/teichoic acid export membrane protein
LNISFFKHRVLPRIIQLLSSPFGKSTIILTTGTFIAQIIGILVTPILSRIYKPEDYGIVALFAAFVAMCSTVITFRYETRVLLPKTDSEAKKLVTLVFWLSIIFGLFLTCLFIIIPPSFIEMIGLKGISSWLIAAVGASVATAHVTVVTNWFNRNAQYKRIAGLRILQAISVSIFGIIAGLLSIKNGLLYSQLLALFFIFLIFIYYGYKSLERNSSLADLIEVAKIHKRGPIYLLPTAILDVVTLQIPFFLISFWFSNTMTGNYRMAYSLLLLPSSLIGSAVSQVFFQRFSEIWPNALAGRRLLIKTWKILFFIGITPMLIVIFFAKPIFTMALGESWADAGKIASILAPMVFGSLIHSPTSSTLTVMGHEKLGFYIALTILIYRPLSFYIGFVYNNFYLGIALFTIFEIVHYIFFQAMALRKINHFIKGQINDGQLSLHNESNY